MVIANRTQKTFEEYSGKRYNSYMKNVVVLHGTSENRNSFWFPWLTQQVEQRGYTISIRELPDTDHPDLATWLPMALKETYTSETILIGHSAGGPLQLSVLENIDVRIKQAILVSGYARPKGKKMEPEKILQKSYNWEKIKEQVEDIIFINSDNDPWGCNDVEGRYMLDNLGKGTLIIPKGEGHMGSDSFNQPYKEFPLLLKLMGLGDEQSTKITSQDILVGGQVTEGLMEKTF